MSSPQAIQDQQKFELYKLEYERAAIRYENIYSAMWQIFQYLAAITGALLAFGGDRLEQHWLVVIACVPLTFWFFATYRPLDRYGNNVLEKLKNLEMSLNHEYGTRLSHFNDFDAKRKVGLLSRVHTWMVVLVVVFLLLMGWNLYTALKTGEPLAQPAKSEVKIVTVSAEDLKNLVEGSKPTQQTSKSPANPSTKP